jgi:toxin ParE1/3/4
VRARPVIPRERANRDIDDAIAHYLREGGPKTALGLVREVENGFRHIARHPATGSLRYGHELDLPGLRVWPLKRFPFLVFYVDRGDHIDVWRVLHGQRDIPVWLQNSGQK